MKRALIAFGFAVVVGFVAGDVSSAEAATPRPPTEFSEVTTLNGVPRRWTLPDGGQSGLFGNSPQCMDLTGSGAQVVMFIPQGPVNVCIQPMTGVASTSLNAWDGGCSTTDTDPNFGTPLQPWASPTVTLDPANNSICAASDAGTIRMPVWRMY